MSSRAVFEKALLVDSQGSDGALERKRKGVTMEPYKAEDVIPIVAKMNGPRGGAYHPCRIKNCEHKQQNGRCRYKPEYKEGKETCLMFIRRLKRSEYIEPHWCDKFEGHR